MLRLNDSCDGAANATASAGGWVFDSDGLEGGVRVGKGIAVAVAS